MARRSIPASVGLWASGGRVAAACKAVGLPYEPRAEQQTMAGVIEEALLRQKTQPVGILPIEAATGTGKTLAYLVPGALHAAKCGSRLLVSTHTIALGARSFTKMGCRAEGGRGGHWGKTKNCAYARPAPFCFAVQSARCRQSPSRRWPPEFCVEALS